jgi:hypothetical protein
MQKIGVSYHYFEASPTYKRNFQHFLTFGCHPDLDVICAIAGPHSVSLPDLPNVRYESIENRNFDHGGHAHVVNKYFRQGSYSHVVFVNSSVRGPFLTQHQERNWTLPFLALLKQGVGLVGASINIVPQSSKYCTRYRKLYGGAGPASHVQSMVYAMPISSLELLVESGFFDRTDPLEKESLILQYEIHLSQFLLRQGLNIQCLLPEYNSINFLGEHADINPTSKGGDPFFFQGYFGRTPHPFQTVFTKTNRDLFPEYQLDMLAYTMQQSGLAYYNCGLELQPEGFLKARKEGEFGELRYWLKKALKARLKSRR